MTKTPHNRKISTHLRDLTNYSLPYSTGLNFKNIFAKRPRKNKEIKTVDESTKNDVKT